MIRASAVHIERRRPGAVRRDDRVAIESAKAQAVADQANIANAEVQLATRR